MIRPKLLLGLVALSAILSGCATFSKPTVLYPIEKRDIQRMKVGAPYSSEVDGWFVSDLYLKEVMDAKVDDARRAA